MGRVGDGSGNGLGVGEPVAEFQRQKLHIKKLHNPLFLSQHSGPAPAPCLGDLAIRGSGQRHLEQRRRTRPRTAGS